jgi:hypothetical protein
VRLKQFLIFGKNQIVCTLAGGGIKQSKFAAMPLPQKKGKLVKVGDLVELSASGRNTVYYRSLRGKKGLVVEIRSKKKFMYPFVVSWFGAGQGTHLRAHLKFVSKA